MTVDSLQGKGIKIRPPYNLFLLASSIIALAVVCAGERKLHILLLFIMSVKYGGEYKLSQLLILP